MTEPASTIAVVPREASAPAPDTVARLLAGTAEPRRIVVVDGGSPAAVRRRLEAMATAHDLTLVRHDAPLTGSEARNLALAHVDTEFVVFVDNDTRVPHGWLQRLEHRARTSGAAAVVPVVLWGPTGRDSVHFAGGLCHLEGDSGTRRLVHRNTAIGRRVDSIADVEPHESELLEFHCILLRTDALRVLGGFDEALVGAREESDLALRLAGAGLSIWVDPDVVVDYVSKVRLDRADRSFFRARWSDDWAQRAFDAFNAKWEIDDVAIDEDFRHGHIDRRIGPYPSQPPGWRLRPARVTWKARRAVDLVATPIATRRVDRARAAAPPPRPVHRASWDALS